MPPTSTRRSITCSAPSARCSSSATVAAALGMVADTGAALDERITRSADRPVPDSAAGRLAFIEEVKATPPAPPIPAPSTPGTVHPAAIIEALNAALPAGGHVFVDAG